MQRVCPWAWEEVIPDTFLLAIYIICAKILEKLAITTKEGKNVGCFKV
jgi:hypothetical protein